MSAILGLEFPRPVFIYYWGVRIAGCIFNVFPIDYLNHDGDGYETLWFVPGLWWIGVKFRVVSVELNLNWVIGWASHKTIELRAAPQRDSPTPRVKLLLLRQTSRRRLPAKTFGSTNETNLCALTRSRGPKILLLLSLRERVCSCVRAAPQPRNLISFCRIIFFFLSFVNKKNPNGPEGNWNTSAGNALPWMRCSDPCELSVP